MNVTALFDDLSAKIELLAEKYSHLKKEKENWELQIKKKERENEELKKQLQRILKEREDIHLRLDALVKKIDSLDVN